MHQTVPEHCAIFQRHQQLNNNHNAAFVEAFEKPHVLATCLHERTAAATGYSQVHEKGPKLSWQQYTILASATHTGQACCDAA
jgi:hypothetical protein